ncbi:MAG: sodium:proton antiporter, partial [Planctomycetes bacterium]|nr:sodium:proton antiporter [Planctomycetota bacterium]
MKEADFPVLLVDTNFSHVSDARMQDLRSECASVLSEYVQEEVDLCGIGRLLAVTPNEEVNAL